MLYIQSKYLCLHFHLCMGTPDNLLFAPQQQNGLITIWPAINTFQHWRAMSFAPS